MQLCPITFKPANNGAIDCATKIFKINGVKGFFHGMSAPIVGYTPTNALAFYGYSIGKSLFSPQSSSNSKTARPHTEVFKAGLVAGTFQTLLMVPIDRIKCVMQTQKQQQYKNAIDCVSQLVAQGGLRSLYRGTVLTLLRDVPCNGIYFTTYEFFKTLELQETEEDVRD